MGDLRPQSFPTLLARALAEHETDRAIFGLPRRSFWRGAEGLDLSIAQPGGRAATPLGVAAGPHTQLAQNIVVGWLAGARVIELKTVQIKDRLDIPRPCIDAADVGYNVEWSQELPIEESAAQYVAAWGLVHILQARGIPGPPGAMAPRFDASVGYDLAGIRSDKVARFLDTMTDAGDALRALRDRLPPGLRAAWDVDVPGRIVHQVTLSTFHGCPPEEIEAMVEHIFQRHRLNVVLKFNPTLLGYEAVEDLLRVRMGYQEIVLDREAFERDLQWAPAVAMFERLAVAAERAGLILGAKFTNTLVVRNTRGRLSGEVVYLSGPPLHPIAIALAAGFAEATGGRHPIAFSGGVDAENFADAVACGLGPVTTCTDLLKPTGYRRLPRYLKSLVAAMSASGARDIAAFIARTGGRADGEAEPTAALPNLLAYASRVALDPRYHAASRLAEAPRKGPLALLDCAACNNCTLVCPNGAFFSVPLGPLAIETWDLVVEGSTVNRRPARFDVARDEQWLLYAGFCNECGNCDPFCPESGGPFRIKPRLFESRAAFGAAAPGDGILIEEQGRRVAARFDGILHELERGATGARFSDGVIEVVFDGEYLVSSSHVRVPREGHILPLWRYHALRLIADGVIRGINPLTAPGLPTLAEGHPSGGT